MMVVALLVNLFGSGRHETCVTNCINMYLTHNFWAVVSLLWLRQKFIFGDFLYLIYPCKTSGFKINNLILGRQERKETLITSLPIPCIFAMPPFAHRTGSFIPVPANAKDRAACPSPNTSMPAIGLFSIWSHNRVNVFKENLPKRKKTVVITLHLSIPSSFVTIHLWYF